MSQFGRETMIPLLPCLYPDETIEFFGALGFRVTYEMRRPYLYLVLQWHGVQLHFGTAPEGMDASSKHGAGVLIVVDDVGSYHAVLSQSMRASYGKVLATGLPRLTRYRAGQSRFSVFDPSGNTLIFLRRDEPAELEYGGSVALDGLAKVIDNARTFRDFKTDYVAAARILDAGLRKYPAAAVLERARALAARAELAILLGERERASELAEQLAALMLSARQRSELGSDLRGADELDAWLAGQH